MPRPRPETQEQVDKTEGEGGLSPLPEALSGQPSPGWKPQNILHMCACVCTRAQPHRGIYTPVHAHTSHMDTATHGQTHAAHTHTRVHRCSRVAVCAHIGACTHMCTCVYGYMCVHVCARAHITHVCSHTWAGTNACVRMHTRRPTGPHKYVHVCAHVCTQA